VFGERLVDFQTISWNSTSLL